MYIGLKSLSKVSFRAGTAKQVDSRQSTIDSVKVEKNGDNEGKKRRIIGINKQAEDTKSI